MPNIVRIERILLRASARSAIRMMLAKSTCVPCMFKPGSRALVPVIVPVLPDNPAREYDAYLL
jgi:hypothetical protein